MNIFTDHYTCTNASQSLYVINSGGGADCMVISSVSMKPCIWFHCSKQLSRRHTFYFNDLFIFFLKSLLCISISGYNFFDAMATSFSSETIKPYFAHDADVTALTHFSWIAKCFGHICCLDLRHENSLHLITNLCNKKCFDLLNHPIPIQITINHISPPSELFDCRA